MSDFFGSLYCWFEDFFGLELANYLWGESSPEQLTNMYIGIGFSMLGISLLIVLLFYYVINHPKFNNWWGWLIFLGINAIINFILAWQWLLKDYYDGFMVRENPITGKLEDLPIYESNIFAFAATNMIDSIILFIIFSYSIKWWSTNCSRAPF